MGHITYNDDKETKLLQSWFKYSKSFMIICQKIRLKNRCMNRTRDPQVARGVFD